MELYSLGRLPEPLVAAVEEHLLVCVSCQERLDDLGAFASAMRRAIAEEPAPKPGWWQLPSWTLAFAAGLAVLVAVVLILHSGRSVAPLASLELTAVRGGMESVVQASETDITLADAPAGSAMRVDLVDAGGVTAWSGRTDAAKVKIIKRLAEGTYFVRLYDAEGKLLHEYGFRVRL